MAKFSLVIEGSNGDELHRETLELEETGFDDEPAARAILQQRIKTAFLRPDAFVDLNIDHGTFVIGAGFWSKKGRFSLAQIG